MPLTPQESQISPVESKQIEQPTAEHADLGPEQSTSERQVSPETARMLTDVFERMEVSDKKQENRELEARELITAARAHGVEFQMDWYTAQMILTRHSLALAEVARIERKSLLYEHKEDSWSHAAMSDTLSRITRKWVEGQALDDEEKTDVLNCIYVVGQNIINSKAGKELTPEERQNIDKWHDDFKEMVQKGSPEIQV